MFLARLNACTLILHAFSICGRVYVRGKAHVAFPGGGASNYLKFKGNLSVITLKICFQRLTLTFIKSLKDKR
jgi:hypothetical protein